MKYDWDTIQEFFKKYQSSIIKVIPDFQEKDLTNDERIHFFYAMLHAFKYIVSLRPNYLEHAPKISEFLKTVDLKIAMDSELPIAKGVGSSASYAVVIAATFLVNLVIVVLSKAIEILGKRIKKIFHSRKLHSTI